MSTGFVVASFLTQQLKSLKGVSLQNLENLDREIRHQLERLAQAVDQPGFEEAVEAARDVVALELGINAVNTADAADLQMLGVISGALHASAVFSADHTAG